jgi:PTS hybrid protein
VLREGGRVTVSIVVVSHSEKIADGAAELAAQMAPDVVILPAGGTTDGRIGTSLEKVMAALDQVPNGGGAVILTDLGSAVMTAESALEFVENPADVVLADAPLVEGLVAAAVAAQGGGDLQAVKQAAEAVRGPGQAARNTCSAGDRGRFRHRFRARLHRRL